MDENTTNQKKNELNEAKGFNELEAISSFQIEPYGGFLNLEDTTRFTKLELSSGQKMQISGLLHQLPQTIATGTLANAYS